MPGMLRGGTGAGVRSVRKGGAQKSSFVPWDLSDAPDTNDWTRKLGSGDATHGLALWGFDKKSRLADYADGVNGEPGSTSEKFSGKDAPETKPKRQKPLVNSYHVWNPDNFVFRIYEQSKAGAKRPPRALWALRLKVDHTNNADERTCDSTMVGDEEGSQLWAWFSDLGWVVERLASVKHSELYFTGALFLAKLVGAKVPGSTSRGQLAINAARNQGAVTDGDQIGSLKQVFGWLKQSGSSTLGGRPSKEGMLCLRSDVLFASKQGGYRFTPIRTKIDDTRGMKCKGFIFIEDTPVEAPNKMALDQKSNHAEIADADAPGTRVYVEVPPPCDHGDKRPPDPSHPKPAGEPSTYNPLPPAAMTGPNAVSVPGAQPGQWTAYAVQFEIPPGLPADAWAEICMPVSPSVAYGKGQSSDFSVGTTTSQKCAAGGMPAPARETLSLTSASGLHTDNYRNMKKTIPASDLKDKDTIDIWIDMMSTSTGPPVRIPNPTIKYTNQGTQPASLALE